MTTKNINIRGYWFTSQPRLNCILLATRKESIRETAKAIMWAVIISGLRNLSNVAGAVESSAGS